MADTTTSHVSWPHWRWDALSTRDFQARADTALMARTVAVLPLGATEQHGPHLPLCVDTAITEGIIDAMQVHWHAQPENTRPPLLILPTQAIGFSPEHASFAGTLTLSATTILALWNDIGAGIAASGVRRVLLFNSHGGQVSVMDMVARQLRQQYGLLVYSCSWFNLPRTEEIEALSNAHEDRFGVHAGEDETAIMRHLCPEWVAMEHAQHFASTSEQRAAQYDLIGNGKSAKMGWMMQDYNRQGAAGNAAAATAEKGQLLVENAARQLLTVVGEISQLPLP
ncbi:creatininase family protein [Lampropedia puyangensis]|uniref:Creatininase family protein n=1 Tax=Lampropedia puyangensis TaxID=1330072 RepID=A0A4S8F4V3_9BURK|nr:creatininase family protein [Lampropedia puyangensis]THU00252.1 creatininase family protein [Lampropedia puyangensis]